MIILRAFPARVHPVRTRLQGGRCRGPATRRPEARAESLLRTHPEAWTVEKRHPGLPRLDPFSRRHARARARCAGKKSAAGPHHRRPVERSRLTSQREGTETIGAACGIESARAEMTQAHRFIHPAMTSPIHCPVPIHPCAIQLRPVPQRDTVYQPRATLWVQHPPTPAF